MKNKFNKLTFKLFLLEYKPNLIIPANTVVLINDSLCYHLAHWTQELENLNIRTKKLKAQLTMKL